MPSLRKQRKQRTGEMRGKQWGNGGTQQTSLVSPRQDGEPHHHQPPHPPPPPPVPILTPLPPPGGRVPAPPGRPGGPPRRAARPPPPRLRRLSAPARPAGCATCGGRAAFRALSESAPPPTRSPAACRAVTVRRAAVAAGGSREDVVMGPIVTTHCKRIRLRCKSQVGEARMRVGDGRDRTQDLWHQRSPAPWSMEEAGVERERGRGRGARASSCGPPRTQPLGAPSLGMWRGLQAPVEGLHARAPAAAPRGPGGGPPGPPEERARPDSQCGRPA